MNNSIYKKKIAFKQSLPQYKKGGNIGAKIGAGTLGVITKAPGIGQMVAPMVENTNFIQDNKASYDIGQGIGATGMAVAKGFAGDIGGAVSSGLDATNEFMQGGSEIAENKGNTQRAERLDKAAMGFQGASQIAGMASMASGMTGGNMGNMTQFTSMFGGDAGIPLMMKNGGKLKQYRDGGTTQDTLFVNPNDPAGRARYQAYQDSLQLFNFNNDRLQKLLKLNKEAGAENKIEYSKSLPKSVYNSAKTITKGAPEKFYKKQGIDFESLEHYQIDPINSWKLTQLYDKYKAPSFIKNMGLFNNKSEGLIDYGLVYKKPTQPVTYLKKPVEIVSSNGIKPTDKSFKDTFKSWIDDNKHDYIVKGAFNNYEKDEKGNIIYFHVLTPDGKNVKIKPIPGYVFDNTGYRMKDKPQEKPIDTSKLKYKVSEPEMKKLPEQSVGKMKSGRWQKDPNYPGVEMSLDEPGVYRDKQGVFTGEVDNKVPGKLNVLERFKDGGKLNKLGVENSLWNNIRANAGSGKKPTPEMLEQERKISKKEDGGLIQYNLPTHEDGGGAIDQNGKIVNPNSPLAVAELEKTETLDTKQNYVFSDTLKPMKSKVTFADLSKRLESKYKNKTDDISVNSKNKELERLAQANEEMRLAKEAKSNPNSLMMAKNGGKLPKYNDGAPLLKQTNWWEQPLGSGIVDTFGTNQTESMNTMTPSVMLGNTTIPFLMNNNSTIESSNNNSSLYKPKSRFAPATMNNPTLTGNKTNPNLLPINNPVLPTETMSQKRMASNFGYNSSNNISTENNPFKMTTGDKMQLGAGALSGITNLSMGMKKPETYETLTSPYFGAGLADMNQNVRFNTNPILMNRNVGMNQINQGSTSDAVRRANLQSLTSNTNRALGELAEKEALANAQIRQQLGQAKIGVGSQDLASREDARAMNIQAKAIAQNLRAKGLEQIYGSVSDVGKGMNQRQTNTIQLNVLNSLAAQYGLDPKTLAIIFKQQGVNVV